jgi:phage gp29-like protein
MSIWDRFKFGLKKEEFKKLDSNTLYNEVALREAFYLIQYLPDPDKVIREMGGRKNLKELLQDDEIYAAVTTRKAAAVSTPWTITGGSDEVNQEITKILKPHTDRIFKDAWMAVLYGYSVLEPVYHVDPNIGAVSLLKCQSKPFHWFKPQDNGGVVFRPHGFGEGIEFDKGKFVLVVNEPSFENPFGEALLSRVFYAYKFRCCGWQYWVESLERFAFPFLHGKTENLTLPDGKSSVQAMASSLDKARRGSSIVTDKNSEVELLQASANSSTFKDFEQSVNKRIQKVILGQTMTTDVGSTGALATAKVHDSVRDDRRRSDIKLITDAVQQIIDTLFYLNDFSGDIPQFEMRDDESLNMERVERDKGLYTIGVRFTPDYIKNNYNVDDQEFTVTEETTPVPFGQFSDKGSEEKKFVDNRPKKYTRNQEVLEDLKENTIKESGETSVVSEEEILAIVKSSRSPEDLVDRLSIYVGADSKEFEELLTKAQYSAKLMGYFNAT